MRRIRAQRRIKEEPLNARVAHQDSPARSLEPESRSAHLLKLQQSHGNQFVQRLLNLQRHPDGPSASTDAPPQVYQALRSPGQPLNHSTKDFFESSFGHDFSDVRVHTDSQASESAESVNALAYTVGQDVVFGAGQYAPETEGGKGLLAHELAHVVQQGAGRGGGGISEKLEVGEADDEYEREADLVAQQVMRGERIAGPVEAGGSPVQRQLRGRGQVVQLQAKEEVKDKKEEAKKEEKAAEPTWDYDPDKLLDEAGVNPEFKTAAQTGLAAAVAAGLRPRVHEGFRSIERSDELYKKYKAGGARAAPGWASLHNYGLAMDVYLYDEKGTIIDNNSSPKTWYKLFKQLNSHLSPQNFVWGEPINDADHWEYHPNWTGLAGGATLDKARKEAMEAAEAVDKAAAAAAATPAPAATTTPATGTAPAATTPTATPAATTATKTDWMQYFWYAAGAGGTAPPPKVEEPKTKADESKTKK
jgi:hypothetical protein